MGKTEVYSWRVDPQLKAELERAAKSQRTTIAALIERVMTEWLRDHQTLSRAEKENQDRINSELDKYIGTVVSDGVSATNEVVRRVIGAQLQARHARRPHPR